MMRDSTVPEPQSILIVKLSAIGDVVTCSPVAQALRERFPAAHLAWAVTPGCAPIARANPCVDEVVEIDLAGVERHWRAGRFIGAWRAAGAIKARLRQQRYDVAIDCQGLLKSAVVSWLSGARRRIGPRPAREGSGLFLTELVPWPKTPATRAEKYLAVCAPLGIDPRQRRPVLAVPEADRAGAGAFLRGYGLGDAEPYVALCVRSSVPQKDWVWERWGELADRIQAALGMRSVLIAGPESRAGSAQLHAAYASAPIPAAGQTGLLQSAAIVQGARGMIGLDTGLSWVALSADVPAVFLYGSTPYHSLRDEPLTRVVSHPFPCSPCHRRPTCDRRYDCMAAITVDEALAGLRALLDAPHPAGDTPTPRG